MPLLSICVRGLSGSVLDDFFAHESVRRTQPLVAASAADLRFGVVSAAEGLGSWGRGWPAVLERCTCHHKPCTQVLPSQSPPPPQLPQQLSGSAFNEHYIAQVCLSASEVAAFQAGSPNTCGGAADGSADATFVIPCRLVILENAFFRVALPSNSGIRATPGTVIAGVDQRHTLPSSLVVTRLSSAEDGGLETEADGEAVQWCAVLDVCSAASQEMRDGATEAVCFTSTSAHFGLLYNLPALPPRPMPTMLMRAVVAASNPPVSPSSVSDTPYTARAAVDDIPPFCECFGDECDAAAAGEPGPLLALTFYANDPRLPYDQATWEAGLTPYLSDVVRRRRLLGKEPQPITTVCYVTDVRPIPVEGSCWCPSNLPMPAPLAQQLREVKKKRSTNTPSAGASITSPPGSPVSAASSEAATSTTSRHHPHRESPRRAAHSGVSGAAQAPVGFSEKGWCVRPLQSIRPVLSDMSNMDDHGRPPLDSNRTQEVWTCLLNLRELDEFGIEVTIKVPYVVDGTILHLKGTTVIFSGMLQSSTSGTLLLPVFCPAPEGAESAAVVTSLWMKLYVQYLLVFPLTECDARGPLEVVRSRETFDRLTVPTLIGHRGLGKTHTRSPAMCGAAPLMMKCSENTVAAFQAAHARRCAMIEFDVMLSKDRVPVVIHDPVIELLALKRDGACALLGDPEFAPVRAEVHKLNVAQLRDLHAQACKTLGRVFPLKDMLMHHWQGLVRWASRQATKTAGESPSDLPSRPPSRASTVDSALMRGEDFPDGVPTLRQVLEQTPPSLRFNLEVKYPFQPRWDSNLFLQSDAFEVNGFVDAILRVVFEFADDGREITFSSFDPNVCLALALKQSRYDVFFLSDTKELRDLKDYRSFYVEGAIQFASAQHLAGISMNAGTLLSCEDEAALPSICQSPVMGTPERGPVTVELFSSTHEAAASAPPGFGSFGRAMIAEMHRRRLKVWTWGGMNEHLFFAYTQGAKMRVDGVIGDRMPVFAAHAQGRAAV